MRYNVPFRAFRVAGFSILTAFGACTSEVDSEVASSEQAIGLDDWLCGRWISKPMCLSKIISDVKTELSQLQHTTKAVDFALGPVLEIYRDLLENLRVLYGRETVVGCAGHIPLWSPLLTPIAVPIPFSFPAKDLYLQPCFGNDLCTFDYEKKHAECKPSCDFQTYQRSCTDDILHMCNTMGFVQTVNCATTGRTCGLSSNGFTPVCVLPTN